MLWSQDNHNIYHKLVSFPWTKCILYNFLLFIQVTVKTTETNDRGIRCAYHATPSIRNIWHYFVNKRRSLGRHSSLADQSHGVYPSQGLGRWPVPASGWSTRISFSYGTVPKSLLRHSSFFRPFHAFKPGLSLIPPSIVHFNGCVYAILIYA
jgi:hypothetical protein